MSQLDSLRLSTRKRFFESTHRGVFVIFGVPALTVALAIILNRELHPVLHRNPFLFFYGAVMVSAWWGGLPAGLLSTALSALAVDHLFSPIHSFRVPADDLAAVALFIFVGLATSALSQTLHTSRQRLSAKLRQEAALAELGRRGSEQPTDAFLQQATQMVAQVLDVGFCKVLQLSADGQTLLLTAGVGWHEGCVGHSTVTATDNTQAAYTLRADDPVILDDVRTETRFSAPPLLTEHRIVSGLSVRIAGNGRPYGVLGAHSQATHAFSANDKNFLQSVANLIAVSVERERKTRELAESELRFRVLAESIPQMCWSTTPDGAVDYISQSWCDFTGLTVEQSLGYEGWKNVLHPDDANWVRERWRHSISTGEVYEVECRLRAADGPYRWILARAVPMRDVEGSVQKWFGTCTDIHEQKLAEEILRNNEKLYAAGRLATTAAHEINNPLACITNLVYLAKNAIGDKDPVSHQYLESADHELQRVAYMVNQTLGFSNPTSTPMSAYPQEIVEELLSVYQQKITAKHLRIEKRFEATGPMRLAPVELRQVIANVLLNAIDASPDQGRVHIHITEAKAWKGDSQMGIRVTVADEGSGISAELRPRLFQPFFTTKKDVGTGLGLWRAKQVLDQHHGAIRFRSSTRNSRSGTVFSVFFPVAETRQPMATAAVKRKAVS